MLDESMSAIPSIWASMYSWFTPTVLFVFLNVMIGTIAITSSLATQKPNEQQQHQQNGRFGRSPSVLQRLRSINFNTYRSQEPVSGYENSPEINRHFAFQQTPELQQRPHEQPYLSGSPSLLHRVKSFNLYNYISQEPTSPLTNTGALDKHQETEIHYSPEEAHEVQQSHELEPEPEEEEQVEGEERVEDEEEEQEPMIDAERSLDEIYSKLQGTHVNRTKSDTKPSAGEIPPKLSRKMKKSASTNSPFAHFEENDIVEARRPATTREVAPKLTEDVDDDEVDARADDFINRFKQQLKLQRIDSIMKYKEMITRGSAK